VEAHGGRIWLADDRVADADSGTRVRFTVPAAAPSQSEPRGAIQRVG
jgi:signal transduction histidine kinase